MKFILYFLLCIALNSLEAAGVSNGLYLDNTDPEVLGGALHPCYRECVANDVRTCYYDFAVVEWLTMSLQCGNCPYTVEDCYNRGCLTAGGDMRRVTVVNYLLPGPSIQACKGDIIQVNVTNAGKSEGVTIHWHGMGQIDTPYMDGVPFVTQCPILPGNTFLYNFTADPAGTHIWHSHSGFQEADGFHGSLIIREPDDVNAPHYDYDLPEHVMLIWRWWDTETASAIGKYPILGLRPSAYSITINGYAATLKYTENDTDYYTPRANFTVKKGFRYRFRSISNSAIYCPVQVSVDNHRLTIISTDGAAILPVEVDSFVINAGERYDFVLTANQEAKSYWIRYRGLGLCHRDTTGVSAVAILYYEGAGFDDPSGTTDYNDANRSGVLLNPEEEALVDYSNNTLITIADLINAKSDAQDVSGIPKYTFYIPIGMNTYANYQGPGPYGQFNEISFTFPPVPFLTQWDDITTDMYCTPDDDSAKNCNNNYCTCPYVYEVDKDCLVEIVVIDNTATGSADHPIHFHGHYLRVVALEAGATLTNVSEVQSRNEAGLIEKNLYDAPLKDVIGVPARGFVVLRMIVDNPGFWLIHCHVSAHFEEGMGAVLKVGKQSEMVQAPTNFPTCSGNYDITKSSAWTKAKGDSSDDLSNFAPPW